MRTGYVRDFEQRPLGGEQASTRALSPIACHHHHHQKAGVFFVLHESRSPRLFSVTLLSHAHHHGFSSIYHHHSLLPPQQQLEQCGAVPLPQLLLPPLHLLAKTRRPNAAPP